MKNEIMKDLKEKMSKSIVSLKSDLATIRSGRANASILDNISVEAYGSMMPINQLGTISIPEARAIVIQPWDKSILSALEKAIQKSDLGLNPNNDGSIIRINLPELTEERRKEMVKQVKTKCEDAKVAVRNIRRHGNDKMKELEKSEHLSEDEIKDGLDEIQKLTDKYVGEIDSIMEKKEQDIMTV